MTPFGQTGPYSQYPATDLTLQALGGFLYVNGDADRPPVRISADLAYRHGGGQGAAGALVAHFQRQRTGRGQHVDVSIQDYIPWTPLNVTFAAQVQHANTMRQAVGFRAHTTGVKFRFTWPCKDGRIAFRPLVTGGGKAQYEALVAWMTAERFRRPDPDGQGVGGRRQPRHHAGGVRPDRGGHRAVSADPHAGRAV